MLNIAQANDIKLILDFETYKHLNQWAGVESNFLSLEFSYKTYQPQRCYRLKGLYVVFGE